MARAANISWQTRKVLLALDASAPGWRYGYDLLKQIGLSSGTLYPLLARLNDQNLVEAEWHASPHAGRPARHAYRLTSAGCQAAVAAREAEATETANASLEGATA